MALLDDIMTRESGRIGPELHRKLFNTSPWIRLVEKGSWPEEMGDTLTVMTTERSLPATTPEWVTLAPNDGSGNTCVPPAHAIGTARTARTYNLQHVALEGPAICANDLRGAWQRKKVLDDMMRVLEDNSRILWEERHRDEYTRLAGHKVIAKSGFTEDPTTFPLTVPTSRLTQGMLDYWGSVLTRDGAAADSVQMVDNAPQYIAIMSPEADEMIKQDIAGTTGIREDIRNSKRADELLGPLGVSRPYRNFYHLIDFFPPRWEFTDGAWVRVASHTGAAATVGTKYNVNPSYLTATYEDTIIYHPSVYKVLLPKPITSPGGGTSFNPLKALGDWRWLNIPDRVENPDQTWGYYRSVFSSGSEPVNPEWGVVIRHLRCNFPYQLFDCAS